MPVIDGYSGFHPTEIHYNSLIPCDLRLNIKLVPHQNEKHYISKILTEEKIN